MKMVSFGVDISDNDIECSEKLVYRVDTSLFKIVANGAIDAKITNVTGDDIVITAVMEDEDLENVNSSIYEVLNENALGFDDLNGVGIIPEEAGEGISYAEINLDSEFYPDALIIGFDTYCGEPFVGKVAQDAIDAAKGMNSVGEISGGCVEDILEIPGVGYVSSKTDDPVILASVYDYEQVGVVAGAMVGAILGNKNTYMVKRGSPANVIPGSVIFSVTALMNYNPIDLAEPLAYRMRILNR